MFDRGRSIRAFIWVIALAAPFALATVLLGLQASKKSLPREPSELALHEPRKLAAVTEVVDVDLHPSLRLTGNNVRYLVGPVDMKADDAIRQFENDAGMDMNAAPDILDGRAREFQPSSLWMLFNYRSNTAGPLVFSFETTLVDRLMLWAGDAKRPGALNLVGYTGNDVARGDRIYRPGLLPASVIPRLAMPESQGQVVTALVRLDLIIPFHGRGFIDRESSLMSYFAANQWTAGIFAGATIISVLLAGLGAINRRSIDYLLFMVAIGVMAYFHLVRFEATAGLDSVILRRWFTLAPFYLYFIINTFASGRLLRTSREDVLGGPIKTKLLWQQSAILTFVVIGNVAMLLACTCYAIGGVYAPGATWLETISEHAPLVSASLLACASAIGIYKRQVTAGYLFMSHMAAACGFALLAAHSTLNVGDIPILQFLGPLATYAIPAEALIWAIALRARYRYFDLVAKDQLESEINRVRVEIEASTRSKQVAFGALDVSYQQLSRAHTILRTLVDTHVHSIRNYINRIGVAASQVSNGKEPGVAAARITSIAQDAEHSLDSLVEIATSTLEQRSPSKNIAGLVKWRLDLVKPELEARDLAVEVHFGEHLNQAAVDGFTFTETLRELLANCSRYTPSHSTIQISLSLSHGFVTLNVVNIGSIEPSRLAALTNEPVAPSDQVLNEAKSTGNGLYGLRRLLEHTGGTISVNTEAPDRIRVTAKFVAVSPTL